MKNVKSEQVANTYKVSENKCKNAIIAFISGGTIGLIGELIIEFLCLYLEISRTDAGTYMIVFFIFLASLFTALGFFDKWVNKCRCGLLIPITGFAHSMTSSCLDYKNEGPIYGIGSNMFKLAGSVIVYGVFSAWIFGMIRYILGGAL